VTLQRLRNIIPVTLSGEAHQDSEPSLAVNPADTDQMVATAFTPDLAKGPNAPIFVSTDGGQTWTLRPVIPGNGPEGTRDISASFAASSGVLYVGILSAEVLNHQTRLQILRTSDFLSTATMSVLIDRLGPDQPWVVASGIPAAPGLAVDRVYVGSNDADGIRRTATVDFSLDAGTAAPPAGFVLPHRLETDAAAIADAPAVRLAIHPAGRIYAVYQRKTSVSGSMSTFDVVVTRDDSWGAGASPFSVLTDPGNGSVGRLLASNLTAGFGSTIGQQRLNGDSAIAVDPANPDVVWIAWGDQPGGVTSPWTIHVRRSTDGGQNWSSDLHSVPMATNPCLAVNAAGHLGFLCQALIGTGQAQRWETTFEVTADGWNTQVAPTVLHRALAASPVADFNPYIGDYARLVTVDNNFYGVFSGSNHPDPANFPSFPHDGIYQRNVNWDTQQLLDLDGTTAVPDSIDPFFFAWTE
jgi:hypothetical protein